MLTLLVASCWQQSLLFAYFDHNSNIVYGSIIRLRHRSTNRYLASGNEVYKDMVKNGQVWVDASGQHAVYAVADNAKDPSQQWMVKGPHTGHRWGAHIGQIVKEGDVIRLENVKTGRNIHTHTSGRWPIWRSPATRQWEVTAYGNNGGGNHGDNWRVDAIWSGSRKVLCHKQYCRFISTHTSHALHSHGAWFNKAKGQQEVTAYWHRDVNDWWQVILEKTPVEHNTHSVKDLWKAHRGGTLNYNTLIWIHPASTGQDRWEHGAAHFVNHQRNDRRLWTHAAFDQRLHNSSQDRVYGARHKWVELLSRWEGRSHNCSWFYVQNAKDPNKTGPVKYGEEIKIFSTFGGPGHKHLGGILNPARQWFEWPAGSWGWGKHHPTIAIAEPGTPRVNTNRGIFMFEPTLRGLKNGESIHQNDLLQIKNKHQGNIFWLWFGSRYSGWWTLLGNKNNDNWALKNGHYKNHRNNLFHRFRLPHVNIHWVPGWARGDFDKVLNVLNTKLGAAAAKAKAEFEKAKRAQAESAKKQAEEREKAAKKALEDAKKAAAAADEKAKAELKKQAEAAAKALEELKKKAEEEKKQAEAAAKAKIDKVAAESERKLQEAIALQKELERRADLPMAFKEITGDLETFAAGLKDVGKGKKKKRMLRSWGITDDNELVELADDQTSWILHTPKDDNGNVIEKPASVSIGSLDGTTYMVTKDGKVYRYNWPGEAKSKAPGNAKKKAKKAKGKKKGKKKKKKKASKKKKKARKKKKNKKKGKKKKKKKNARKKKKNKKKKKKAEKSEKEGKGPEPEEA